MVICPLIGRILKKRLIHICCIIDGRQNSRCSWTNQSTNQKRLVLKTPYHGGELTTRMTQHTKLKYYYSRTKNAIHKSVEFNCDIFSQNSCRWPFWMTENDFRISRHFRPICDFYFVWIFFTKWPPAGILDDRKSLSIAFLAISDHMESVRGHWKATANVAENGEWLGEWWKANGEWRGEHLIANFWILNIGKK